MNYNQRKRIKIPHSNKIILQYNRTKNKYKHNKTTTTLSKSEMLRALHNP